MHNIWTIARREYQYYFASPIAYVLALFVFIVVGAIFAASLVYTLQSFGQAPPPGVQVVTGPLMFMLVFVCPALTMRLLSEEQRLGTLELLLTAPVRDWELVVGKWLGAFLFVLSIVAVTFVYPVVLNMLVEPGIDQGPIVSSYLGVLLVSAAFLGIGVAISSLFSNQVVSFIATFIVLIIFWWLLSIFTQVGGEGSGEVLRYLDLSSHFYNRMMAGVIELSNVVYMVSLTALALFLGSVSVEMRRWR
jgi:ABC-2 type transport system permease protein